MVTRWSGSDGIEAYISGLTGFLQCFDAVGWVIWSVKIAIPEIIYKVSSGTLSIYSPDGKTHVWKIALIVANTPCSQTFILAVILRVR